MRRARRLQELPSSSEDDNDFAEKGSSSSSSDSTAGTSNLSSLYANEEEDEEGELFGSDEEEEDDLTTAPSSSSNNSIRQDQNRDRRRPNQQRNNGRADTSTRANNNAAVHTNGDDDDDDDETSISDSSVSYDSDETAESGDVRVSNVLMRGGDITSRSSRNAMAAMASLTRRQLLGEGAGDRPPPPTTSSSRRNHPQRDATTSAGSQQRRRGGNITTAAAAAQQRHGDDNTNIAQRVSTRGVRHGNSNHHGRSENAAADEGEFVRTDSVVEDFDSEDDDDDDESDTTDSDDYDDEYDEDDISDDNADFEPAGDGDFDDDEVDEDEEEENVLFDLSERLGGGANGPSATNSIKPLLQCVRTIIRMEKAVSAKTDQLKAFEARRATEALVTPPAAAAVPTDVNGAVAADNAANNNNSDSSNNNPAGDASGNAPQPADNNNTTAATVTGDAPAAQTLQDEINEVKAFLAEAKPLLTDQWAMAAQIIYLEFVRAADKYSHTLDNKDRAPLERLARIMIGREELFEIIDGHLLVSDMNEDIPRLAAFVAYMVSEGAREPVFGATAQDLFPVVLTDTSRLKRIVALTSLFTLLDKEYEEERTINELLMSDVPSALLMRIREYTPTLIAPFKKFQSNHHISHNGEGFTTTCTEGDDDDEEANLDGGMGRRHNNNCEDNDNNNNPPPLLGEADEEGNGNGGDNLLLPPAFALPSSSVPQTFLSSLHNSSKLFASSPEQQGLPYIPKIGDIVVRGPEWKHTEQDHACKRGVIVGIVSKINEDGEEEEVFLDENGCVTKNGNDDTDDEHDNASSVEVLDEDGNPLPPEVETYTVLVRWDPVDDISGGGSTKRRINKGLRGKLFKYTCGGYTNRQVVSLAEHRRLNFFDINAHDFKLDEYYLMTAICGILSHKKQSASLIIEHQTIESMVSVLHVAQRYHDLTQELVLSRISTCKMESDEEALDFEWFTSYLQPPAVHRDVKACRTWRELTARALWVLNGAITHKQLGRKFLQQDGLPHILALANAFISVPSHKYGCGLLLSQLAKSQLLSEVVDIGGAGSEDLLPEILKTTQALFEIDSPDIKQAIGTCYYWGLSYIPFLRLFDGDGCIVSVVRELKLALGFQGHTNALLPADQRPVEIDMFVNKNSHLINIYLRAIFMYLSSHLLQLGMVLFRRQRSAAIDAGNHSGGGGGGFGERTHSTQGMERIPAFAGTDSQLLPRDDAALEAVIAALHQPDEFSAEGLSGGGGSSGNLGGGSGGNGLIGFGSPTAASVSSFGAFGNNFSQNNGANASSSAPSPVVEYVAHTLISQEQWKPFRMLVDELRLHELLLLIIQTFETHRKRDVRMSALNVLYVLSVAPCTRAPIAECFIESPDSIDEFRASHAASASPHKHRGIKVLLQVTEESDLTSKEAVLANVKALNVLALLMMPPLSVVSGHNIATFDRVTGAVAVFHQGPGHFPNPHVHAAQHHHPHHHHHAAAAPYNAGMQNNAAIATSIEVATSYATICSLFRACDGVKTLLALKLPSSDTAGGGEMTNLMPLHFYMFAALVFTFSSLRYFGDTPQLFSVLGVRKLAVDLQSYFRLFRQQTATDAASEPMIIRTFMNNCLALATTTTSSMLNNRLVMSGGVGGVGGGPTATGGVSGAGPGGVGARAEDGAVVDAGKDGVAAAVGPSVSGETQHFDADGQERRFVIEHAHLDYNKDSLLELIARHLQSEGLVHAADVLRREADLPESQQQNNNSVSAQPPQNHHGSHPAATISTPAGLNSNGNGEFPRGSSPLLTARQPSVAVASNNHNGTATNNVNAPTNNTSLDGIIRSFLRHTQEQCPRPIATLPKIDLLRTQPIVGFDYAPTNISQGAAASSYYGGASFHHGSNALLAGGNSNIVTPFRTVTPLPTNLSNRLLSRKLGIKQWNGALPNHYRQIHRSRFPMYELRNTSNDDFDFAMVDFCDFGESIIATGTDGTIVIFNHTERGTLRETHLVADESEVVYVDISPDCQSIMTVNREGAGKLLRREALSSPSNLTFEKATSAMFSPQGTRIVATLENDDVSIIDAYNGTQLTLLTGMEGSTSNHLNIGVFDVTGTLVLNHGTLFDLRQSSRPVFRFDCVSEHFSGIFHPNGLQTIVDGNLWDLRTMSTVLSCPAMLNTVPQFSRLGTHFYASVINTELSRPMGTVNVVETRTMNLVTTFHLDSHLETFALNLYTEDSFATVNECADADKILKVYQIGRHSDHGSFTRSGTLGVGSGLQPLPQSMEEGDDDDDISGDDDDLDDDDDEEDEEDDDFDDEEDDLFSGMNLDDSDDE